ncbi:MAG: inositol monophosphatase [Bacteroidetes bacterium]|nr:MAG: inositol monophosphatase [Bacteroidota bacterium]REJ99906.1 MAG: inositol monophosphatase [Bacteroidota bacterium]REK34279.1 MAG: inositol monophosphatase [Bacteroidota bacterium]REK50609.1 MAG: inositol monophosphatase [Bacteroidota bacterium]
MNLESICKQVEKISRKTREFILYERKKFSAEHVERKGHNDLVSYVDKEAEKRIVEGLRKLIPEAGFYAEESKNDRQKQGLFWVIDPLDGTTNFIHGLPCFCISIALMNDSEILIGLVHELNFDECFYAWKDGGAFMNDNSICVSQALTLKDSLLATGFPYADYSRMKEYMEVFDYFMRNTHGLRRLGSAAADLAYLACGRFEAFYEYGLNAWDVAAGALIVKEAGGKVSDFSGSDNFVFGKEIIAANSNVFDETLEVIRKRF